MTPEPGILPDPMAATSAPVLLPSTTGPNPLVSVLIPCCGQLEYTRLCLPSLLRHSRWPLEVIFVDVGSMDGTAEFLDGFAAAAPIRAEVIHVQNEAAFGSACQEGLTLARGEFVVWLNNDVIVTDGWLNQLVALAGVHPAVGLLGPMANYAPQAQRVPAVPYRLTPQKAEITAPRQSFDTTPIDRFAQQWREEHKGQWFETDRLGGFCLCFKRDILQRIRLFDDKADPGVFDADAVCWKVRQAGFRCAVCGDLFIHHFGSRLAVR